MKVYEIASSYYDKGLRVIPLGEEKTPKVKWKSKEATLSWGDVASVFFQRDWGIGVVCGCRSGNLEVLDFDKDPKTNVARWLAVPGVYDVAKKLVLVETPSGGFHFYYRCSKIEANQVLASTGIEGDKPLIETRGEGGMVVAPGGWPATHELGKPYLLKQGSLLEVPIISKEERDILFAAARSLSLVEIKPLEQRAKRKKNESTWTKVKELPGEDFNTRATWEEILEPKGWRHIEEGFWRRPGKDSGVSAVADETFHCFSTSVPQFEPRKQYNKWAVYTILYHDGDFKESTKELRAKGYGGYNYDLIKDILEEVCRKK